MSIFIWDECQLSEAGIQYNENHDSYSIQINREGGSTATRKLTCAWGDAVALAQALRGNSVEVGGELVYTDAASHPVLSALKVSSVNITPVGKPLTTGTWEQAFLDVSYDVPEFGSGGGGGGGAVELKEQSLDISAFNEVIPGEKLQFTNGKKLDEDAYVTARVIEYRCTLYRQATLPLAAIAALVNKVNNAPWEGVAEGVALYGGAEANRTITDEGNAEWTISHVVYIASRDQRMRYNNDAKAYQKVFYRDGEVNREIYEAGDFSTVGI